MPPKNRRGGLRSNPLDAVIPDPSAMTTASRVNTQAQPEMEAAASTATTDQQPQQSSAAKASAPEKPVKFNGYVSVDHADRARDALYVLPGAVDHWPLP